MAIAKIKKIELIGLEKDKEQLLALLQKQGKVQLIDIQQENIAAVQQSVTTDIELLAIEEEIEFLAAFREKTGFLQSVVNLKPVVFQQELKEVISNFDWRAFVKELSGLRAHLKELTQHKERLLEKHRLLNPWRKLNPPLDQIQTTQHCRIFLGVLSTRDYSYFWEDAIKEEINFYSEIISQDKANTYLAIVYIREDFERLEMILKNYRFNFTTLGFYQGTVRDNLLEINIDSLILDDQILDARDKIAQLSKEQFRLKIIYDYLANIKRISEADKNLAKQQFTFALSGWIKNKDLGQFEKELSSNFREIAVFVSEPKPGEDIPVILENKRFIRPFEFITGIYGMPQYNELDPTPFLAPFFFLYFGLCVSDVGYGLILFLISWLVLKKIKMGPQGNKFWTMFLYCGISTIIIGALTGSWFGNLFDLLAEKNAAFLPLKNFKDSIVLLDPLKEPTKLLGVALSLGIIQVWFGNIVAAIGNIKNKRYLDIVLDQAPMLTLLFGLTGLGLIFLKLLGNANESLFKYAALSGAIGLVLTQGRLEKGIGGKLFYGIYNLYNALSGYLSDILSYSRLWALGLVTGVMAGTINLIAIQFSQIIPSIIPIIDKISLIKIIISSLILVIIFVCGHLVSLLMNLLGAFVHPLRLQFVEFFSKFFKSGGSNFRPFKIETKYINIS